MKRTLALILSLAMVFALVACGQKEETPDDTKQPEQTGEPTSSLDYVAVGAGATGGNFYMTTSTFCQTFNEKFSGTTCNAETTTGSVENNKMLLEGDLGMCISNIDIAYCAATGTREFSEGGYSGDIRVVLPGEWNNVCNIIARKDSGITAIEELKGKTIACNSGTQLTDYTPLILKEYGLNEGDYKIQAVTTSEMADAMRDKHVDAIIQFGAAPVSAFADLASTTDCLWLSISEEHMNNITSNYPYFGTAVIPANTYIGQTEDVTVLANMPVFVAMADLDEGFVYQFLKTTFDNLDDSVLAYTNCKSYTLESLVDYYNNPAGLELHSGAVKYLESVGAI